MITSRKALPFIAALAGFLALVPGAGLAGQADATNSIDQVEEAVPAQNQVREALAWCTAPNDYGVRCDGPTQRTEVRDSVPKSLEYVGCQNPRSWMHWGDGVLYFCNRPLKSYERDIRSRYNINM